MGHLELWRRRLVDVIHQFFHYIWSLHLGQSTMIPLEHGGWTFFNLLDQLILFRHVEPGEGDL